MLVLERCHSAGHQLRQARPHCDDHDTDDELADPDLQRQVGCGTDDHLRAHREGRQSSQDKRHGDQDVPPPRHSNGHGHIGLDLLADLGKEARRDHEERSQACEHERALDTRQHTADREDHGQDGGDGEDGDLPADEPPVNGDGADDRGEAQHEEDIRDVGTDDVANSDTGDAAQSGRDRDDQLRR